MFSWLIREVKSISGCSLYVDSGNVYITKGKAEGFPCMVAHMDTVHDIVEDLVAIQVGRNVTGINPVNMRQSGIGGDDKVGIFIALECLRRFDNLKVVFFRDEEEGCLGSYDADIRFFKNCNFVLQCDRQGASDFVITACGVKLSSRKFQSKIAHLLNMFDYQPSLGMMTDVMALKERGVDCSVANMSCGYFNPHTPNEFVNLDDVERCLELVKSIITEMGHIKFPHEYSRPHLPWLPAQKLLNLNTAQYCQDCWAPVVAGVSYCEGCAEYYRQTTW